MDFSFDFVWERSPEQITERIISPDVRLFAANKAKRFMDPYVPADALALAQNTSVYVQGDEGIVEYHFPYAHYQYVGEGMAGRAPKHYTGQPLTYHGGALRGKQWDKRMMADHGKEVEKDLEGYLKGRGK